MRVMADPNINSGFVDSYFDRVFYINLDGDHIRDSDMKAKLLQAGISNFERFPAIKAYSLPHISKWRNFIKTDLKYLLGSLGCRASHLACVRLAKGRGYKRILILEDDVVFLRDPNGLLAEWTKRNNDPAWDLLYFGGLIEPDFRNQIVCLHAYGVSSRLYDDVIEMAESSGMEIDNFYAKIIQHMSYNYGANGQYQTMKVEPFNQVVQDKRYPSNIQS